MIYGTLRQVRFPAMFVAPASLLRNTRWSEQNRHYPRAENHPGRVPKRGDCDIRSSASFDHPGFARPGRLRVGHRHRRDGLERSSQCGLSGYSGGVAGQRRRVRQTDRAGARSIRSDALGHSPPARGGDGVPYRIEYGVRTSTSAPVLWIEETGCWFAGADGRPARAHGIVRDQQRTPRPRRAAAETVAQRSADRRTQPHPSGRGRWPRRSRKPRASARPSPSC